MKEMGMGFNTFFVALIIGYLLYIWWIDYDLPEMLDQLFNNVLFRLSALVLIVLTAMGHKETGLGGPMVGILLAIAFVITMNVVDTNKMMEGLDMEEEEMGEGEEEENGEEEEGNQYYQMPLIWRCVYQRVSSDCRELPSSILAHQVVDLFHCYKMLCRVTSNIWLLIIVY